MFIVSRKEKLSVNDVQLFANTDQFDTLTCTCIYSSTVKVQYAYILVKRMEFTVSTENKPMIGLSHNINLVDLKIRFKSEKNYNNFIQYKRFKAFAN